MSQHSKKAIIGRFSCKKIHQNSNEVRWRYYDAGFDDREHWHFFSLLPLGFDVRDDSSPIVRNDSFIISFDFARSHVLLRGVKIHSHHPSF